MNIFQRAFSIKPNSTRLYDETEFYKAFSYDFKGARQQVLIESPYITVRRAQELSSIAERLIERNVAVRLYTRTPSHHEGVLVAEAYEGIRILQKLGIRVTTCDDMRHRKIAIIDDNILWEGSLNMLSQNGSREIMRRTYSADLCKQMKAFLGIKWYSRV